MQQQCEFEITLSTQVTESVAMLADRQTRSEGGQEHVHSLQRKQDYAPESNLGKLSQLFCQALPQYLM